MWNDWLSSLTGPADMSTGSLAEIPEPIETPRRFNNPAQIERLQSLQSQHQQLQVQQLHLLHKQIKLQRELNDSIYSGSTDGSSSVPHSPTSGKSGSLADSVAELGDGPDPCTKMEDMRISSQSCVKSETDETRVPSEIECAEDGSSVNPDVWQQFHALQAQQWAQALNQARIAKRQPNGMLGLPGVSTPLSSGVGSLGLHLSSSSVGGGMSGGKRCKAYAAPKGVWKNNGGYNATIYVHKRRIYGPIRRDLSDAIEDRKEMEEALRELTAIHSTPDDAAILEVEMREVVAGLRNRSTPNRPDGPLIQAPNASRILTNSPHHQAANLLVTPTMVDGGQGGRKRLRLVGNTGSSSAPVQCTSAAQSPDTMGPFSAPMQVKAEDDHVLSSMGMFDHHDDMRILQSHGYTPSTGPIRDLYGSPDLMMTGYPHGGLLDDSSHLEMLPDSLGGSMWSTH